MAKSVHTEGSMLRLLRKRFAETRGNGPAWVFVPKVRDAAGFEAKRTADAVAMSLWPSRGLELHGFEIKVSRGDWQRELAKPEKAEAFCGFVDRWWLVVSDAAIVKDGELPPTWGLLAAQGSRLVAKVEAPRLRPPDEENGLAPGFNRSFLAALLRASVRTGDPNDETIREAVREAQAEWVEAREGSDRQLHGLLDEIRDQVWDFERESGVKLRDWHGRYDAAAVGAALRLVLDGDHTTEQYTRRLAQIASEAESIAAAARRLILPLEIQGETA